MSNGEVSITIVQRNKDIIRTLKNEVCEQIVIDQSKFKSLQRSSAQIGGLPRLPSVITAIGGNGQLTIGRDDRNVMSGVIVELPQSSNQRVVDGGQQLSQVRLNRQAGVTCQQLARLQLFVLLLTVFFCSLSSAFRLRVIPNNLIPKRT